ncbi:hypothetical protein [Rhizorhabdus argentea]|uniref:hypothetical protein n=1 Tax=Rhizorhabdus argentea TaxID=1387174 RepID=UPI0030ECAE67
MDMIESDVRAAYRWILGRDPDEHGLADYVRLIKTGEIDSGGLRDILLSSAEFWQGRSSRAVEERKNINDLVIRSTGLVVQSGPFAGMRMVDLSTRGDGDIAPKLLGTYEAELHPWFERFRDRRYDAVVDVGCAEGYYSVGAALMFPGTPVLAYDVDKGALDILRAFANENGCAQQIIAGEFCDPDTLRSVVERYPRSLIVVDCEGYEKTLFSNSLTNSSLASSDIIIECHDLWDAEITPTIRNALSETHDISEALACGRNPNVFPFLAELNDWDRWRSVWERRGSQMHWLICEGKAARR